MRHLAFLISLFLLASCGFQPLHGNASDYDIEVSTYLASTKVEAVGGDAMLSQQLENAVTDRFNPDSTTSLYDTAFRLEFSLAEQRQAAIVQQTGVIGRYNIILSSKYKLIDAETRAVLDAGTIRRTASFFNAPEKYAAYIAEKDAVQRALLEMSEDYKMRIAAYFAREYKLGPRAQ